jgi:hypothetical protein
MFFVSKYGEVNHGLSKSLLLAVFFYLALACIGGIAAISYEANFFSIPAIPFMLHSGLVVFTLLMRYCLLRSPYDDNFANKSRFLIFFDSFIPWIIILITAVISGELLFSSKIDNWLFCLFLPVAGFSWWSGSQREKYKEAINLKHEEEFSDIDDDFTDGEWVSETSVQDASHELKSAFYTAGYIFLYIFLALGLIALGFRYYYYLRQAFIFDNIWSLKEFFYFVKDYKSETVIRIIVTPIVLSAFYFVWQIFLSISAWWIIKNSNDVNRELSKLEIDFIDQCIEKIKAYLTNKEYSSLSKWAVVPWLLLFLLIVFGTIYYGFGDDGFGRGYFENLRSAGHEWSIYKDDIGVFEVFTVFAAIFLTTSILWLITPKFGDMHEKSVLDTITNNGDKEEWIYALSERVALDVRRNKLTIGEEFSVKQYILSISKKI